MNYVKRNSAILINMILLILVSPVLIGQSEEQMERFQEEKVIFFNEKLDLTEVETEKFWPIYDDFNNRKMKLAEEEKNIIRYFHNNSENISDQEVKESLSNLLDIHDQKYTLEIDYHRKFSEILPERKVMMLYVADREFRMHLLNKIRRHGQGPYPGRGQGGRSNEFRETPMHLPE